MSRMDVKMNLTGEKTYTQGKGEVVMEKKFLFCNVSYMKFYEGHDIEEEEARGAGKFIKENGYGMEEYNFLNYDGQCYGYVRNPGQFNLERLDATAKK